ncbi:MAG: phage tail tape measure protein, partial [Dehalococcoidales bacterium]|nr:phage tail tape measure protein [Dehalococcoidales bacterium]
MSTEISNLVVTIGANTTGFQNALKSIKPSLNSVATAVAAISAAVVGFGIKATTDFVKAGDEVHKMSLRTGFATETLSKLRYAAQIGGTSIQGLETGIKRMQRVLVDASRGLETSARAINDLGLSVDDLMGMDPEEQFMTILRAVAGVEDATLKAALAQDIFGKSGTDLLPILEDGVEGLENTMEKASDLGVVFDEEAAAKAANLNDQMTDMKEAMNGVKNAIGEELAPVFIPLLEGMTNFITKISDFMRDHPGFITALEQIGLTLLVLIAAWKALSIAMAVAQAMSGPAGWTMLAIGAGVAIGAIAGI